MYKAKTLLVGLAAAGLLLGATTIALGHGMQGQDRIPSGGHGMGQGQGMIMEPGMHYGYGMGHGMMERPGMHPGHGMGHGMPSGHGIHPGHGMHHDMKIGPGMHYGYGMHHGMKMDPDAGQGGGLGPRMLYGWPGGETQDLSVEGARGWLERKLDWHGNPRLKLGEVVAADDDTITAEIVTKDGSLVQKLAIDRHSGFMRQIDD